MGRLIDADLLKKNCKCTGTFESNFQCVSLKTLGEVIDAQPTAYDPDKVVHQLEERTAFLKDCTKYGNKTADQQPKSYDTMMMYEVKDLVDDLLEIVKAGGADAEH